MDVIETLLMTGIAGGGGYSVANGNTFLAIYSGFVVLGMIATNLLYTTFRRRQQEQRNEKLSELEFEILKQRWAINQNS